MSKKVLKTAGVYIDGSNLYHGGKVAGWKVDYTKLKKFIERKYKISIISYYNSIGYKQNRSGKYLKDKSGKYILDDGAVRFENGLKGCGIRVVSKPLKFIRGDESTASNKLDGEIMIDALLEQEKWDELILFTGDCDFERLVTQIASLPKQVHIFSFGSRISHELKVLSFESPFVTYTNLDGLKSALAYTKKH